MSRFGAAARHVPSLGLGLGLVLALLASVAGLTWLTVALVAVSLLLEGWVDSRHPARAFLLEQTGLAVVARFLLRVLAVTLVIPLPPGLAAGLGAAVLLLLAGRCFVAVTQGQLARAYASPVLVRNIDLPATEPDRSSPSGLVVVGALGEAAVLVAALVGAAPWVVALLGLLAAGSLVVLAVPLARQVLPNRHERVPAGELAPKLRPLQSFLDSHRPEVLVHLSGAAADTYQVNVWLETLESLDQRVLVLIRTPDMFNAMAPTTLPAACVRSGADVMSLDLSCATVALFPAHVGSNLHILRLPTLMSAFIGHGDSDKNASFNPFAKAYDELWVAGAAGARRWRRAAVGVREDQLVTVGRPQIAAVQHRTGRPPGSRPTLLYAPTWEGWAFSQNYCSVTTIGLQLVAAALAHPVSIRVIYKPHPMLGRRDPKVMVAHERIVRLLRRDVDAGHEVVQGGRSLVDCFNASDAMATDVSSVVTDYLASEKPYAVYNFTGDDPATFTASYPSALAATILGPDGSGVASFVDVVSGGSDLLAQERARLATDLLGAPAMRDRAPFQRAVTALSARAQEERAAHRAAALRRTSARVDG